MTEKTALEPGAEEIVLGAWRETIKHDFGGHRADVNETVMASIAISMKRIADALTGDNAGHEFSQNIYHAISTALFEAQQRQS